jgi:predicted ATPase
MRQFIQSKISPTEQQEYQRRHAHYFAKFLEGHKDEFIGKQQTEALDVVQVEADNVRAAIRWAVADGEAETALTLVASTWRFCEIRGYLTEG